MEKYIEIRTMIEERLNNNSENEFAIAFCGVFSSGKSSLINGLLEYNEFLLPIGIQPVTKLVTKISYAKKLSFCLEVNGQAYPVTKEEFNQMVTGKAAVPKGCTQISISMPATILKHGVVFYDTPGFDDEMGGELEKMSRQAVLRSDFVVFCTNALQFGKLFEKEYIEELNESIKNFCLVVNRMDCPTTIDDVKYIHSYSKKLMENKGCEELKQIGYRSVYYTVADGKEKDIKLFARCIKSMSEKNKIKREIKASTKKILDNYYYKKVNEKIDDEIERLMAENQEIEARHKRIIDKALFDIRLRNNQLEQKKSVAKVKYEAQLNLVIDRICQYSTALEQKGDHQNFVENTENYILNEIRKLACEIDKELYEKNSPDSLLKRFTGVLNMFHIPIPIATRERTRGAGERVINTVLSLLFFGGDVDDGYSIVYRYYSARANSHIKTELNPKLLTAIVSKIDRFYGPKESEENVRSGLEQQISKTENEIKKYEELKDWSLHIKSTEECIKN